MMKRFVIIIVLALVVSGGMVWAPQPVRAAHVVERIIARVNAEIITQRQYEKEKAKLREELAQQYSGADLDAHVADETKNLLRNLIDMSLMVQKAQDEDINVDTDLVKKLDDIRKQDNLATIEDVEKEAESQGVNWEDFKDQIRRQLLTQEVISREVGSRIIISRSDMLKYYQQHKDDFKSEGMIHLNEILISSDKHKGDEAAKLAKTVEADLKDGAKFSDEVKKYSDGPATDQGGDIGLEKTSALPPTIAAAVDKLDVNQFTDAIPIKTGYLILRIQERFSPGVASFDEVEDRINDILYRQAMEPKMRDFLTQLRKDSYVFLAPGYIDTGADTPGAALTSEKTQ